MKRLVLALLVLAFFTGISLTGCKEKIEVPIEELPQISLTWTSNNELKKYTASYSNNNHQYNILPIEIEEDLSNIENLAYPQYFTEEEINEIIEKAFLILEDKDRVVEISPHIDNGEDMEGMEDIEDVKIQYPDEELYRFITTDLVLYNYFEIYKETLLYIEENHLYESLKTLSKEMLDKSITIRKLITDPSLIDIANENIVFFLVANMIINNNSYIDLELDNGIIELAKKEYDLIEEAIGIHYSPLFDKQVDYSLFKSDNHYETNVSFDRFNKLRTWYCIAPMQLMVNQEKGLNVENVQKTLLLTYIAFVNNELGNNSIELWNQIYYPANIFTSNEKYINIMDIRDIIIKVFGENFNINEIGNKGYFASLFEEIRSIKSQNNFEKQFSFLEPIKNIDKENLEEEKADLFKDLLFENEDWYNKTKDTINNSFTQFQNEKIYYLENEEKISTLFIEPNISLYSELLWLMEKNTKNLELRGLINSDLLTKSNDFIVQLQYIINISYKELNNESLSEEDVLTLNNIVLKDFEDSYYIYAVIPYEGKLYLTKGLTYSSR